MKKSNRIMLSFLQLVFPPISNQEALWLKGQPAEQRLRSSDFYMIAGKAKSTFKNIRSEGGSILYDIYMGSERKGGGCIVVPELSFIKGCESDYIEIKHGENSIEFLCKDEEGLRCLEIYTPESVLWARSRQIDGIYGLDNFRELMVYDLLYVGIAKKGDSYNRLISNGHLARQEILSSEPQRLPGARVSDEIFLFFFEVEPLFISSFGEGDEIDFDFGYDQKSIVADAEKAFVNLLKPDYNVMLFKYYPKGTDGLYNSKLNKYSYSIGETLTFNTPHGTIKGGRDMYTTGLTNDADFIYVDKFNSTLFVAGADFGENFNTIDEQ